MFFLVFSVRIGRSYQKFFDCQSHMSSAVFCAISLGVLLHQEVWKLVSTLELSVENIMQKDKVTNSNLKGFNQKSCRMHIKKSFLRQKMCHNLKKFKGYEEKFSVQM